MSGLQLVGLSISLMPCLRQDFQFFPPKLTELQERELAVYKVYLYLCLII